MPAPLLSACMYNEAAMQTTTLLYFSCRNTMMQHIQRWKLYTAT